MRAFEYRLYPTRLQQACLLACLRDSRALYNEMLECERASYHESGRFLTKYDLTARFKGRGGSTVPATTVQCLADRLAKALRTFLAHKDEGWGFPRFKSANRWHSIHLRQHRVDFRLTDDGTRLQMPAKLGGSVKIKLHRPLDGTPKACHLVLRADGHWYAVIVCDPTEADTVREQSERPVVGIDVGITHFLADSDGAIVENPRCYQQSLKALRRKQRALSRRTKDSQRRKKAARSVAKIHLKVQRQRTDFHHKVAKSYADRFSIIVVEDLNVRGLARGRLAREIHDAGWSAFLSILTCKAASAGGQVIRVPAHFTSQRCSCCGEIVQKALSVRTHICPSCGLIADRDVNAARNILQKARAGAPPSGTVDASPPVEPRSRRL